MQTLDLSGSAPRSESRLKSLFWPSIQTADDVDYLGSQGYWVCSIVAVFSLITLAIMGHPITGPFFCLFFYLGGVGVREHSRYAAIVVFAVYAADSITSPGVLKVFFVALLLSNLRAAWIASRWKPESSEAVMPIRLSETWGDKFADKLPQWLWPKIRILFYVFSAVLLALTMAGLVLMITRHRA